MKKILFVFGTRPEIIKLAPVINVFKKDKKYDVKILITSQHKEMLNPLLSLFNIKPDFNLNVMIENQSLFYLTSTIITKIERFLNKIKPDLILIQGDTTTAFAAGLASFYKKIRLAHIEAGLRTYNKFEPFPEELNRRFISQIADLHFAPTKRAIKNLKNEGINKNIYLVGNTIIDSIMLIENDLNKNENLYKRAFDFLNFNKKIIILTVHRRENLKIETLKSIFSGVKKIALTFKNEIEVIYPFHLNPIITTTIKKFFKDFKNLHLVKPLNYSFFLYLLKNSFLVLTDSGGIQEEASFYGKPLLILRNYTERPEIIDKNLGILTGTDADQIYRNAEMLILDNNKYKKMAKPLKIYGNGNSSEKIKAIIDDKL